MASNDASTTIIFDSDSEENSDWDKWTTVSGAGSDAQSVGLYSLINSDSDGEAATESEHGPGTPEDDVSLSLCTLETEMQRLEEDLLRPVGAPELDPEDDASDNDEWTLASPRMDLMDRGREVIDELEPDQRLDFPTLSDAGSSQGSGEWMQGTSVEQQPEAPIPEHRYPAEHTSVTLELLCSAFDEDYERRKSRLISQLTLAREDPHVSLTAEQPAWHPQTLEPHGYQRYRAPPVEGTAPSQAQSSARPLYGYDSAVPTSPREQTPEPSADKKICLRCGVMQSDHDSPPPRPLTESCAHPQGLCSPCVSFKIQRSVSHQRLAWNKVPCPECPQLLDFQTVLHFVPQYLKERLEKESLMSVLSIDDNFVRCSAAGCSSGQVHEGGHAQPIVTCISCGQKTCFIHKEEWHAGVTCAEIDWATGGPLPPKDEEHEFPVEIEDEEEENSEDEEEDDSEDDEEEDSEDEEEEDSEDDEEGDSEDEEEEDIAPRRPSAPGNKTNNTATPASVPMRPCPSFPKMCPNCRRKFRRICGVDYRRETDGKDLTEHSGCLVTSGQRTRPAWLPLRP
ncbi:hypothetical protein V8F33_002181 [Rhypophila sp. PSN 637]